MAADPKYGTFYARGIKSGAVYAVDCYNADAAGLLNFDGGNGASSTSPQFYTFPEDVTINDFVMNAGAAATYVCTTIRLVGDGRPSPSMLRVKAHLDTLNNRPMLGLKVRAGTRLTGLLA